MDVGEELRRDGFDVVGDDGAVRFEVVAVPQRSVTERFDARRDVTCARVQRPTEPEATTQRVTESLLELMR